MNKYVLKSSQLYVHLDRQKKFQKKAKKISMDQLDHVTSVIAFTVRKFIQKIITN